MSSDTFKQSTVALADGTEMNSVKKTSDKMWLYVDLPYPPRYSLHFV